jgi:uroporphyrinogen III methyltransferase/synthase
MTESGRPLAGRRVLLTRRPGQTGFLESRLADLGASVVLAPAIEIGAPEDMGALDEALLALDRYEWLVFTSPNAVAAVKARLEDLGRGALPARLKLACVGRSTTAAVSEAFVGRQVELEPEEEYGAEGLTRAFAQLDPPPGWVFLPVSNRSRPDLANGLRALGATVDRRIAYRIATPPDLALRLEEALAGGVDLVLFASPSAVQGFVDALGARAVDVGVVAIGPTTEHAAREAGFRVLAVANPSTAEGLVAAVVRVFGPKDP